jgi:hypothetical protein
VSKPFKIEEYVGDRGRFTGVTTNRGGRIILFLVVVCSVVCVLIVANAIVQM